MDSLYADDIQQESPIKILVVDDREDNLFSIETILENENYIIVKAHSGKNHTLAPHPATSIIHRPTPGYVAS